MTKRMRPTVCRSAAALRFQALWIAATLAILVLGSVVAPARAQLGGPLLTVQANPLLVRPGGTVTFLVVAHGAGARTAIDVDVPSVLTILPDVTCVHSTSYCDESTTAYLNAETNRLSITAPGALPGPDGPEPEVRVTVTFSVFVPREASPGTEYVFSTTVAGMFNLLDPNSVTDKQVTTIVNVSDPAGRRAPSIPTPIPTPTAEPAASTAEHPQVIRFDIEQGDISRGMYLIPGEQGWFNVEQGFRNVAGPFTLSLLVPPELVLTGKARCSAVPAEHCTGMDVTQNTDGTTAIEMTGESVVGDTVSVDFAAEVLSRVLDGAWSTIRGHYAVTDASTGKVFTADLDYPVFFVGPDVAIDASGEEGTLRVTFERSGVVSEVLGGCVSLDAGGRWGYRYFVCDNDSAASRPSQSGRTILSDTEPRMGLIVVAVAAGEYTLTVESLPEGFTRQVGSGPDTVTVPADGAEYTVEGIAP